MQTPFELQVQLEPLAGSAPQPVQVLLEPCVQVLLVSPASQPLLGLPSQSRCVVSQLGEQAPPEVQSVVPKELVQVVPQAPQLLVLKAVSQPSSAVGAVGLLQFRKPEAQVEVHTLPEQMAVATWFTPVPEQARPQAPQLATLVEVSVSQPFAPERSQSASGAVQLVQTLLEQVCVYWVQEAPPVQVVDTPHLLSVMRASTSQPSVTTPLQSAKLVLQV